MGNVQYFGGSLLCLVPKTEMSHTEMETIVQHINSSVFQKDYMYAGRFKIGHKQISTAMVPV
jgi:adenine-specific DNA-methyltransferase